MHIMLAVCNKQRVLKIVTTQKHKREGCSPPAHFLPADENMFEGLPDWPIYVLLFVLALVFAGMFVHAFS
jgi:hypothetical protein